jgi:hypothetical protein
VGRDESEESIKDLKEFDRKDNIEKISFANFKR